ncbi:ribose-phosphate pyrophosphokinase [Candidatus Thermokryptus mobilis]|uniref:Ribose-phosphate pyrophosphokinase n=1 Tax=Candidatus Thermokryptus mobilis TaxID=1643428 RepID=A0A0S4MXF2_9BACT|nr:ribose-phosphate pyrophosphokinase [Candidatus Thermokryptus mobilis]CUU03642.1 ribose-phosphate pyrophosphokinase [Candidatus Thermokryptus mobilis]
MSHIKIFSGRSSRELAEKIAEEIGEPLGSCEIRNFSDGEIWVKYLENIRGNDVFIIQSTFPPSDNLMELLIMIDAAKRASARRITAVIPYFGYARQDRKDQPRVPITSKLVANLITVAGADRVLTMDLHAPQIQGFFDIPFDHLYSAVVLVPAIREMVGDLDFVVVSPDIGGVKFARGYAKRLNAELVLIDKRRLKPNESEVVNVVGDVKGKVVVIVDDIIDTAGTFVNAALALIDRGAKAIYGACTHPILSGNAIEKIENIPVEKILVTDTIPLRKQSPKIEVKSVARIFAEAIKRIHCNESLSVLFEIEN